VRARLLAGITVATLAMAPSNVAPSHAAQRPAPECDESQECRQLALEARARGQYERFHDLAWRTVQTGPANDPALMYLLARAQSLSGRPGDALIVLRRLADRGVVTAAATEEDFNLARRQPGWRALEVLMERVAKADAAPAAERPASASAAPAAAATARTPPTAPAAPLPVPRSALRVELRDAEEVAHFSTEPFVAGGLAYDAVSRRFLLGDVRGRRVIVVGEGSDTTVDLVRAAGAGFHDITAFAVDTTRGDLWVASTARDGGAGAVHRLQLVSGRAIATIESPPDFDAVRLIDVAIAAGGTILVLDDAAPRVIRLRSGATTLESLMPLDVAAPASIAAGGDEGTAFVAHRDGIVRLDLRRRSALPVTAPEGIALAGFAWIRWHRNALVGVQVLQDGSRRLVRLQLAGDRAVASATVLDASTDRDAGPPIATVSGGDVYYLVTREDAPAVPGAKVMDVVVKRVRLP
jgi:hypothetical protein